MRAIVTAEIRSKEVSEIVSPVSSIIKVREIMVDKQREIAKGKDVVMEGRDITTVVFPDTPYKFYLDASVEVRAQRRYKENLEVKEGDLEKELSYEDYVSFFEEHPNFPDDWGFDEAWIFAKHFFELGLKARKL
mgnify:CR=1 FL=1